MNIDKLIAKYIPTASIAFEHHMLDYAKYFYESYVFNMIFNNHI